ncbi:autotransporter outer membrane beta-barrel domain-containing protein, partial [Moraxella porci]|uniref:autotransporter outer membrane beta-barrel domain-containing protein n=1 Tax=Moraxella porci TaxID=1288392 RepID=UPI00244A60B1
SIGKFENAVNTHHRPALQNLAQVLDAAIADKVTDGDNTLADALIIDATNGNDTTLANMATQLQPLLSGSVNRLLADDVDRFAGSIFERSFEPNKTVWAKAIGNTGTLDAQNGLTGFDSNAWGVIAGADTAINDSNIGLAIAYGENDADSQALASHHAQADTLMGYLYANHSIANTTAHAHIGVGTAQIKGERRFDSAIAYSDYDADIVQAGFGISHQIGSDNRNLTPFVKIDYSQVKSDAYIETGADAYNLSIDAAKYQRLTSTAGIKAAAAVTPKLRLAALASVGVDNGDKRSDIDGSFVSFGDHRFGVAGHKIGKTVGTLGAGIQYQLTPATSLSLDYQGQWRDNYESHGGVIGIKSVF